MASDQLWGLLKPALSLFNKKGPSKGAFVILAGRLP